MSVVKELEKRKKETQHQKDARQQKATQTMIKKATKDRTT